MTPVAQTVRIEAIRIPHVREKTGALKELADSIDREGLRHPVTAWTDGTLISGGRRMRAHYLLGREMIQAVFVGTLEEAARRLLIDFQDDHLAVPMKWSESCRLWEVIRRLDAPAAVKRADANRRRGVELRRMTQDGRREAGRSVSRSEDYIMTTLAPAWGVSCATTRRIEIVYQTANGLIDATQADRDKARKLLDDVDNGGSIWDAYKQLLGLRDRPTRTARPKFAAPREAAAAARQVAAWDKALPQLEGLIAGLIELGPPNKELTWSDVGPVHTRLALVRRNLEKIIKPMKEINPS